MNEIYILPFCIFELFEGVKFFTYKTELKKCSSNAMKMHSGVAGDGKAVAAAKEVTSLPANEIKARIPHQDVAISEEKNGTEYGLPCRSWKYRHFVKKFFILFGKP